MTVRPIDHRTSLQSFSFSPLKGSKGIPAVLLIKSCFSVTSALMCVLLLIYPRQQDADTHEKKGKKRERIVEKEDKPSNVFLATQQHSQHTALPT